MRWRRRSRSHGRPLVVPSESLGQLVGMPGSVREQSGVSVVPRTRPAHPPAFRAEPIELPRAGRTPRELSESLGIAEQTLRNWHRQDQINRRERDDGVTTDDRAELVRLCRENTRLRQKRDLLKRAAALFATESGTP
jgi:transposase